MDKKEWEKLTEEAKEKVSTHEVVTLDHEIKRKGDEYFKILCPFHDDNHPSMAVYDDDGFKCFTCNVEGGNAIDWVVKRYGLSFKEALFWLKREFGLEAGETQEEYSEIRYALKDAVQYYRFALRNLRVAKEARAYLLEERNLSKEVLNEMDVGYAPKGNASYLESNGQNADKDDLVEAGVLGRDGSRYYERYWGRIIFPIRNFVGALTGMAGRRLPGSDMKAKYINTPDTPLYAKKKELYGAGAANLRDRQAILVEGYTDVLRLRSVGIENVVATCGTSFTKDQARKLDRVEEIVFLFDGDSAGREAARKALGKVLPRDAMPTVALLPPGKDPADIVDQAKRGEEEKRVRRAIRRRKMGFVEFMVEEGKEKMETAEGRVQAQKTIGRMIGQISDRDLRREYMKDACRELNVPPEEMYRLVQRSRDEEIQEETLEEYRGMKIFSGGKQAERNEQPEKSEGHEEGEEEILREGGEETLRERFGDKSERQSARAENQGQPDQAYDSAEGTGSSDKRDNSESTAELAKRVAEEVATYLQEQKAREDVEELLLITGLRVGKKGIQLLRWFSEEKVFISDKVDEVMWQAWSQVADSGKIVIEALPYSLRSKVENMEDRLRKVLERTDVNSTALNECPEGVLRGAIAGWVVADIIEERKKIEDGLEKETQFRGMKEKVRKKKSLEKRRRKAASMIQGTVQDLDVDSETGSVNRIKT